MSKVWRAVIWIAVAILAIGLVLAGVGWLTGASTVRIIDLAFGSRAGLMAELDAAKARLLSLPDVLRSLF